MKKYEEPQIEITGFKKEEILTFSVSDDNFPNEENTDE